MRVSTPSSACAPGPSSAATPPPSSASPGCWPIPRSRRSSSAPAHPSKSIRTSAAPSGSSPPKSAMRWAPSPRVADLRPALVCDSRCALGENPLWHPDERRVYWTDITSQHLHRLDPRTSAFETIPFDAEIGGFTIQADGSLLLFMARGRIQLWRDGVVRRLVEEIADE